MSDETTVTEEPADTAEVPEYSVYLAGPMTNIAGFNFPLFFAATDWLRSVQGWGVKSPAEKDLENIPWDEMQKIPGFDTGDLPLYCANSSFTMGNAMEWDLPAILNSNGIVLLPGWEKSTGARWERTVAEALGRDIWLLSQVSEANWALTRDTNPTALTDFLRTFGTTPEPQPTNADGSLILPPDVPPAVFATIPQDLTTKELIEELHARLDHVPEFKSSLEKITSKVVL